MDEYDHSKLCTRCRGVGYEPIQHESSSLVEFLAFIGILLLSALWFGIGALVGSGI